MAKDIIEISNDLKKFETMVLQQTKDPLAYDVNFKIPAWRDNSKVENYSDAVQADVAKFRVHVDLMQNTNDLINNESINKVILQKISKRFQGYAELYLAKIENKEEKRFCEELIAGLNSIKTVLDNYARPAGPSSPRP